MSAAVVSDVLPGEAVAAAYLSSGWTTTPAEELRRLAKTLMEGEPIWAGVLLDTADGKLEQEAAR